MDTCLYDTSLTLFSVTDTTLPYRNLLSAHPAALHTRAVTLRAHLSAQPKYEATEEQEKIGALQECTWTSFRNPPSNRRREADGVVVVLAYERITYKFILYSNSKLDRPNWPTKRDLPLLMAKASASLTRRFCSYLAETFQATVSPLKIPPTLLVDTAEKYISLLYENFVDMAHRENVSTLGLLKDTLGTLKLTISVNPHGDAHEIAQHLRTIDIDIPAATLLQLLNSSSTGSPSPSADALLAQSSNEANPNHSFLVSLQQHVSTRTGLNLPLVPPSVSQPDNSPAQTSLQHALRITRISTVSFALSSEGRLKFSSRSYEALNIVPGGSGIYATAGRSRDESGSPSDDGLNLVQKSNTYVLEALVAEAVRVS